MFYRKNAVALAAACMLASAGMVMADGSTVTVPTMSLEPTVLNLDAAAPRTLLMSGLEKCGVAKTLDSLGISIYGYVEIGYDANLRNMTGYYDTPRNGTIAGPGATGVFTGQGYNRLVANQLDLNIDRAFDPKKPFDVGGKIEVIYGADANLIHAHGTPFDGNELQNLGGDAYHPAWSADPTQAYVDISLGQVGKGLVVRAGKFVTFFSYETISAVGNPFYSRSLLFSVVPFTQTGVIGMYNINPEWAVKGGVTRGWDESLEDSNGAVDFLGAVTWTPNKNLTAVLNLGTGPEDAGDTAHYRTVIDPVVTYKVNDKLNVGAEVLYIYDGGYNGGAVAGIPHSYGDAWGGALYAGYAINNMFKLNGRFEKLHDYRSGVSLNIYEATAGVTITPFPTNPIGKNLIIRPEIRYDFSEDTLYAPGRGSDLYRDQWTLGADVIFTF